MSVMTKTTGTVLAIAAASLIGCTGFTKDNATSAKNNVHCYDVNKCKGHNDCKTASNACKGHGSCKGHGFVSLSASACDHIGGKVGP